MSFLRFLVAWANVPFTVVGGITVLFALLQLTGILSLLASGEHGDGGDGGDGAHDGGADADAGEGHDVGDGHDAEHGGDDADQDGESWTGFGLIFGPLGVGKIPMSIIWQSWTMIFAVAGLSVNVSYLGTDAGPPTRTLAWSLPIAFLSAYTVVAILARLLTPLFSTKEHEATSRAQLVGHEGVVISSQVTQDFGEVRIRDRSGHDLRVICRLAPGAEPPKERQRVVVVDYDASSGLLVAPIDDDGALNGSNQSHQSHKEGM